MENEITPTLMPSMPFLFYMWIKTLYTVEEAEIASTFIKLPVFNMSALSISQAWLHVIINYEFQALNVF